jgi:hypothetical protein
VGGASAFSGLTDSTRSWSGSTPPTPPVRTETGLTGEKAGVPDEYADTAARPGKWEEVQDSHLLNATVYGTNGEENWQD